MAVKSWEVTPDLGCGRKKSCKSAVVIFSWLGTLTLNWSLCFDFVPFVTDSVISVGGIERGQSFHFKQKLRFELFDVVSH